MTLINRQIAPWLEMIQPQQIKESKIQFINDKQQNPELKILQRYIRLAQSLSHSEDPNYNTFQYILNQLEGNQPRPQPPQMLFDAVVVQAPLNFKVAIFDFTNEFLQNAIFQLIKELSLEMTLLYIEKTVTEVINQVIDGSITSLVQIVAAKLIIQEDNNNRMHEMLVNTQAENQQLLDQQNELEQVIDDDQKDKFEIFQEQFSMLNQQNDMEPEQNVIEIADQLVAEANFQDEEQKVEVFEGKFKIPKSLQEDLIKLVSKLKENHRKIACGRFNIEDFIEENQFNISDLEDFISILLGDKDYFDKRDSLGEKSTKPSFQDGNINQ
ncbi:hypothetical protein FGO68_gene15352 [Halteria grandinella]|uniref:Uncharacterized protein n=1 Tax=Halteria grandinella TaxID=5974 RepID=A0A8J8NUH8_HALGN|nr:hypothetical protein FGO68_gene15352 [Halteria grandinella]